jgi:ligand-binding sensor domain-containing protein
MKQLIPILLFLISLTKLAAQAPKFRHFQVEEGLPSATVYQTFQDSRDFLWFSTEAGLSRFDGTRFRNFSMDEGLPDNEIFGLFEDSKNRLWFRAYNGHFGYLSHDTIFNADQIPLLKSLEKPHWVMQIFEDSNGDLYFSQHRDGLTILKEKTVLHIEQKDFQAALPNDSKKRKVIILGCFEAENGQIHILSNIAEFILKNKKPKFLRFFNPEFSEIVPLNAITVVAKAQGTNDLYFIDYQWNEPSEPKKILSNSDLLLDSDILILGESELGGVWLGSLGEGLFLLDNIENEPQIINNYLENQSVSSVLKDKEGNLWMTTLGDGAYMLSDNKVLTYKENDGLSGNDLYAITGNAKRNIFVGTQGGKVNFLRPNGSVQILETGLEARRYNRITALELDSKENLWVGSDVGLISFGIDKNFDIQNVKSIKITETDEIYVGSSNGLYFIDKNLNSTLLWKNRVNSIAIENKNKVWLGSNTGLYFYNGKKINPINGSPLYRYRINDLAVTDDGTLCICTAGNGILLKKENKITQIHKKDGLASNVCTDIFLANDGVVWVATNGGVSKFSIKDNKPKDIFSYTETEYLASNEVRSIFVRSDTIWASTSAGLSYIEGLNRTKKKTFAPTFYILGIKIRDRDTTLLHEYDLSYDQNDILIEYTGISFKSGTQVRYRYQMEGLGAEWIETSSNEAHFPFLQPGNYTFRVKAISIDGKESAERMIRFIISPPWWKRQIFIIGIAVFLLSIVSGLVYYTVKNREDKMKLKRQISESERMALRAQMNPHFIFNALNSIQHFITMEDEVSANYYLSQFAKLIRRVLENSKAPLVSLEDEITTLELYLALEALRFEGKFEYKINIDQAIDTYDVELPSMIIQPFAENAIWHGLMPKQGGTPTLTINFKKAEEHLICEIRDNGIGREAASKVSKSNLSEHQSTGISNTVRRLSLMSKMENKVALVEIVDLKEGEEATGTMVIVRIPFLHFEE